MDFSALVGFLDPVSLSIDGGIAASIIGLTGKITDYLKEIEWHAKFERFYFFVPFAVAFVVSVLQHGFNAWGAIIGEALRYGLYATITLHGYKKVVQGK